MRTLFIALLAAFFAAGCSHKGLVTTYSVASTQQMVVPSVKQSISAEFCGSFGETIDALSGKFWEQVYVEAFTNTLNKAKRDGIVADALANPSIVRKSTFSLDFCSVASGKPVGLKLVK